jgi:formate hydrogenlyase subunit 6/NADH:ubiquinone oxidoreductase subunit I
MGVFKIGKMIISSMFKKPATLMYPVIPRIYTPITRGHIEIDIESCILCGICSKKCPTHAIVVERKKKEWAIARLQCIQCNCCVEFCPVKCLSMANTYSPPVTERTMDTFAQAAAAPAPVKPVEVAATEASVEETPVA